MKEPPSEGPDDWFFDERLQQWLRRSGCARWRRILAERAAHPERREEGRQWLQERFGVQLRPLPPAADRVQPTESRRAMLTEEQWLRFRAYIRERMAYARTPEAEAARRAFLARFPNLKSHGAG